MCLRLSCDQMMYSYKVKEWGGGGGTRGGVDETGPMTLEHFNSRVNFDKIFNIFILYFLI